MVVVRRRRQDELRQICGDPVKAREFLLNSSMISTLARAASVINQGLTQHTEQTTIDPSELLRELEEINENGFSVADRQYQDDLCCLAVPVLGHCADRPTGLTIHCHCSQMSLSTLREHSQVLKEQSQRLAAELGGLTH